ncbi:rbm5-a: RNA-binding protein 5-A [Gossypium arboreum]|uniref:Rbm5-a: RNA-binding protein 5-A n=1 Tax=Gossypium arboreum TaxID=29729 RepID=A0A0B0NMM6_GOSAR|nr:rbm5-a: RNA-binding protein 5-A [Gossypium arboreum]
MDHAPARYPLQRGWDNNSALEGFSAVPVPNYRVRGSYDERRFLDERYSRDSFYPRSTCHHYFPERDNHSPPAATGVWSQSRERSYEEEYPRDEDFRHHQKLYVDSYRDMDTYCDHEIAFQDFDKFQDGYRGVDNIRDHEFGRPSRAGTTAVRGIMNIVEIVMILVIKEAVAEMAVGGSVNHVIEIVSVEKEIRVHIKGMRGLGHDPVDVMIVQDQGHLEFGAMGEAIERTAMIIIKMRKLRSKGTEKGNISWSIILWCASFFHAPSATVVVKGLSHKTTEEDLCQILAEWGPLRHVRVIKERTSGISHGFAFIDFPSVGAARSMMDKIGDDGLVVDGRKLVFDYSSKPTGGTGGPSARNNAVKMGHSNHKSTTLRSDWMCKICGCVNFARRTACFQCNEQRTDDAPVADISLTGKRGSDSVGPTHVLVVRGLDENADEEMLRYEFSKYAPIKDLRLVRDKFTHVSRGFAFVHYHSVGDATKALEATNGTTLEKNGQILRVAYARSIIGPRSGTLGSLQSSSLAAAAIEAAAFSQQYDAVGWTAKEYNPDDKQSTSWQEQVGGSFAVELDHSALHSGFVWDEASGYYFDAASGFYYDRNTDSRPLL